MDEYIKREALLHAVTSRKVNEMLRSDINEQKIDGRNPSAWLNGFECGMQQAIDIIAHADVAEVVRCKDCRYWGGVIFGYICRRFSGATLRNETRENDYCSYGERKGEGE